jgi:hypothetical protein
MSFIDRTRLAKKEEDKRDESRQRAGMKKVSSQKIRKRV